MANYYTDHPEIGFHLNHPLMRRVAELKERIDKQIVVTKEKTGGSRIEIIT